MELPFELPVEYDNITHTSSPVPTSNMSTKNPPVPVVSKVADDDIVMVTLYNNNPKNEIETMKAEDSEVEHILRAIFEFWNMRDDLGIANSAGKTFSCFRQVLSSAIRSEWDMIKQDLPGNGVGHFCNGVDELIRRYVQPNDLSTQKRYLETYRLPVRDGKLILSVPSFTYRLRFINKLMALFPGAPVIPGAAIPGGNVPYNDEALKTIMFNALPDELQDAYIGSGRDPTDATVGIIELARRLDVQVKAVTFKGGRHTSNVNDNGGRKRGGGGRNQRRR